MLTCVLVQKESNAYTWKDIEREICVRRKESGTSYSSTQTVSIYVKGGWWAKGCKIEDRGKEKKTKKPKREEHSTKGKESFVECKRVTIAYPAQMFVAEKTYQVKEI